MTHHISIEEQQDITQQIDLYLKTTFKDKIKRARAHISSSVLPKYFIVMANRSRFYELYIRFNQSYFGGETPYKTIVLAKIYFGKTKQKLGSKLLYELIQITKDHDYKYMMLECVNQNSRAFAQRLGFEAYLPEPDTTRLPSNYFIPIDKLEPVLKNYLNEDL